MVLGQPVHPVLNAAEGNGKRDLHREADSGFRGSHFRPREKRDVGSRMAVAVGVKEVIRTWRILVDAFLDKPHSEHAGIKVDVVLRIASDAGYMVETGDACHESLRGNDGRAT